MTSRIFAISALLLAGPFPTGGHAAPDIVPVPAKLEPLEGVFTLEKRTRIVTDSASNATGEFLSNRLHTATGYAPRLESLRLTTATIEGAIILTTHDAKPAFGPEGYELLVTTNSVVIRAPQQAGLFYGVQTFLQLLQPEVFSTNVVTKADWQAPCARIEDQPRFRWRGMMLDVSRHFQGKAFVENYLDQMAMHKLNTFHWHLVDDQGWRLEIKKYPKLTSVGAWRKQPGYPEHDGIYGGFYTQDDIREVVAYAAARHITIVPEIEIPGHSQAALAAYPEFSCSGQPGFVGYFYDYPSPPTAGFPPHSCNVFCAANPKALEFIEDVLTETMSLFPSQYIHIGGDEVETNYWRDCPKCQARMKAEGLKDYHELQAALTRSVEQFLSAHQRRLIGWDEILAGGLAPNATVMSWRGIAGGLSAVKAGHDAVMSPNKFLYFNRLQSSAPGQPPAPPRANISLETVYNYEPVPAGSSPEQAGLILGAEACLWTERLNRSEWLETMTYPRLCALAEVTWSPKAVRSWDQFSKRMEAHRQRLDAAGVTYFHTNRQVANAQQPSDKVAE